VHRRPWWYKEPVAPVEVVMRAFIVVGVLWIIAGAREG
jgi:hypothetical protein